ncbi:glycosyltransferase [uncultured Ruminococcus sp.]|uniref:glycosyltransferase n=1 Tax=uncultured Ruminococcus sp. TaxID=165186 RepID=UPI00266BF017|nr:glycosyltransferase [uncultured Ruminococcus sp.]
MIAKVSVLGHFGRGETLLNGQTVKTKIITEELQRRLGRKQVLKIDTRGGWKTFLKAPFQSFYALKSSRNILIFPAQNGLRVYVPLLSFFRLFFKNRRLHYVVIGGWLPSFLTQRKSLTKVLKKFDGIYVETATMKDALETLDLKNVFIMPNCKKLNILKENELVYNTFEPYRLCTFSRVMKKKGIEDAIIAVEAVNKKIGRIVYELDIYGQIDSNQTEWFEDLRQEFPSFVRYCGCVDADKSVEIIKEYFALLFPTHFYTEGIPGTIIDAYAAGVPVISAKWESFDDVIEDYVTGIGYEFNNINDLKRKLFDIIRSTGQINSLKLNCIKKSKQFLPNKVIKAFLGHLL